MPLTKTTFEPGKVRCLSPDWNPATRFRTAVSLHSHTRHSRESLSFIPRFCERHSVLHAILKRYDRKYERYYGHPINFNEAWWTPPLCARQAVDLETRQAEGMGLAGLVSITDHDNIEAASLLSMTGGAIVSVEWSIPYHGSELHVGVHNMPAGRAPAMTAAMNRYTRHPVEQELACLLEWLTSSPESLVVFNHPVWDEMGVGEGVHMVNVECFLVRYGAFIHALELNGLRSWNENRQVISLARKYGTVVVSGGDRHTTEPNAVLNLTSATTFGEFAREIRQKRESEVLLMPHYRQARALRLLHNVVDVLGEHPARSLGQKSWSDRVFYRGADGVPKSLSEFWGGRLPTVLGRLVDLTQLFRRDPVRAALRFAFRPEEVS